MRATFHSHKTVFFFSGKKINKNLDLLLPSGLSELFKNTQSQANKNTAYSNCFSRPSSSVSTIKRMTVAHRNGKAFTDISAFHYTDCSIVSQ